MFIPQLNLISMVKIEILSPYFVHVGFPQLFYQACPHPYDFAVQVAEDEGCAEEVSEEDLHREGLF